MFSGSGTAATHPSPAIPTRHSVHPRHFAAPPIGV